ncbi:MAG: peptidase T [Treponema sp.]|jgi:tripeptide aminopeptidase|nr:peptidase T [Treponema sp.]
MNGTSAPIPETVLEELIVPRFLKYVRYWTESDRRVEATPSTPGQWDLAKALAGELRDLGAAGVELTGHCYVTARIPASPGREKAPVIGFLAHLDTAGDVSGKGVNPCLVKNYDGQKIELAGGIALDPAADPDLAAQKGKTIIHADGTTLLGADDKAGVAEIAAAAEYLMAHPEIPHGEVEIIFSPDEETGKGLPEFPADRIRSVFCYTVDGGPMGELEAECFNAWKAEVEFRGRVIHVGAARGILVNAALMAAQFAVLLPRSESPEATDGFYGYYCPMEIRGDLETAFLEVYLRDFDGGGMRRRLDALEAFASAVEAQFPGGTVTVNAVSQYNNMKEKINQHPEVIAMLKKAFVNTGVEIRQKPIRGGTDGSRLAELGIPAPNIFTGGRNFHSRLEWVSVPEMCAACRLIIELIRLWGEV